MKIIKFIFALFFILILLVGLGLFIFLRTFNINRYKPQITDAAKNAIGREVDFKDINLAFSFTNGLGVSVNQLTISDDPQFQQEKFASIQRIFLGVEFWPLLTQKKISVSAVEVISPEVKIIRAKDGSINAQTVGKKPQATTNSEGIQQLASPTMTPAKAASLPLVFVKKINISGGRIKYIDKTFDPELEFEINQAGLKIENLSLDSAFPFSAEAAVLSTKKNFSVNGLMQIKPDAMSVKINNCQAQADFSSLATKDLLKVLPMLAGAGIKQGPNGKLNIAIPSLEAGAGGLTLLSLNGTLTSGEILLKQPVLPISNIQSRFDADQKNLSIKELALNIGSGKVTGTGAVNDYLNTQNYNASADINQIDLGKAIDQGVQPTKLEGLLSGKINLSGQGFDPDKALDNLSGNAEFNIKEGRITNINILKNVLDKISMLPDLSAKIEASLPQRYKDKLTQKDTIISKADAKLNIQGKNIYINPAVVEADGFLFEGAGTADFNKNFSLSGNFYIPEDLSRSMISIVKELQYLLDEQKRILIPVQASGKAQDIKVSVDLEYLGKKFLQSKGQEELGKFLDKVLKKDETPAQETQQQEQPTQQGQTQQEEIGIGSLLDMLFKD